jgi:hypothetical protein
MICPLHDVPAVCRTFFVTTHLQHKTKLGWPHNWMEPTTPTTKQTVKALSGNSGSWFSVCNLILTQLDKLWKTTSIFLKIKDDLNFFQMYDDLNFVLGNIVSTQLDEIWKKTSIFLKKEDNLNIMKMEDNLNFFENGKRPEFFWKCLQYTKEWKTT